MSSWFSCSFADPAAPLLWEGERLCCRAVGSRARLLRLLWGEGVLQELSKQGLLAQIEPRTISEDSVEFPIDICQSFRVAYCYEWSPEMWKAGALHIIELLRTLVDLDLTLQFPYPWHLLFVGARPLYINPGSIAGLRNDTFRFGIDLLSRFFLYPLALAGVGQYRLAQYLLRDFRRGVQAQYMHCTRRLARKLSAQLEMLCPSKFLDYLKFEVEAMEIPSPNTQISQYSSKDTALSPEATWNQKQCEVHRTLSQLHPRSVLDLGCNTGWYSRLASMMGADSIALDFDEKCIDILYRRIRDEEGSVLPLVMDINDPSPGFGIGSDWFRAASPRLKSDLVLALAICHHLVLTGMKLTFDQVVSAFAAYSKRWLLVEFIPFDSERMSFSAKDRIGSDQWYKLETFLAALESGFGQIVSVVPSVPIGRRLILCER